MGEGGDLILKTGIDTEGFEAGSKKLGDAIKSFGNSAKNSMKTVTNSGRSVLSTIKRWGPALLGVGSAYQIISRAVSTFMSQNQQLSAQMSSVWTSIGNLLGPIITQIVNLITTAVSYFLTFLRLIGVTSKSASELSKAGKAAGGGAAALQKSLMGFDELNLLQDNSGGGGGGGASGGLKDLDPPEWMQKLVDLIKNKQWRELGAYISDGIIWGLNKVADYINKVPWKKIGDAIREFFLGIKWEGIADAIFNVLKAAWNGALDLLWGLLAGDTDKEPPIIGALRKLGEAFEEVYKAAKVVVKAIIQVLGELFGIAVDLVLPTVINLLADAIKRLAQFIQEHQELIRLFFEVLAGWLIGKGIAGWILKAASAFQVFGKGIMAAFDLIAAHPIAALIIAIVAALIYLYRTSEPFRDWCNNVWGKIKEVWNWLNDFFELLMTKPDEAMKFLLSKLEELWGRIQEWFSKLLEMFNNKLQSMVTKAGDSGRDIVSKFMGSLDGIWGKITGWFSNLQARFQNVFQNLINSAFNWGAHLISNLVNGIMSRMSSLASAASAAASQVRRILGHSVPKEGPLSHDDEWGGHMVDNFISGIESSFPKLKNAVTDLAETARFDKVIGNIEGNFDGIANRIADISQGVAFARPVVAAGNVMPYSVSGGTANSQSAFSSDGSLAEVISSINSLRTYLSTLDEKDSNISLNVYLDGNQIEAAVTKRQSRNMKARGLF